MINVAVVGALGKMGKEVIKACYDSCEIKVVCAVDVFNIGQDAGLLAMNEEIGVPIEFDIRKCLKTHPIDVVIDFTQPNVIFETAKEVLSARKSLVIGTTGLSDLQINQLQVLAEDNGVGALVAPNFSTGAVLLMKFAQMASKYFNNAEIIELHHNQKKDAPSGTAIKTAKMMSEINENFKLGNCKEKELIEGARGANANGNIQIHSVRLPGFMASEEVLLGQEGQILSLRHDTFNRKCYMDGVLLAIRYVYKNKRFVYGLEKIMD